MRVEFKDAHTFLMPVKLSLNFVVWLLNINKSSSDLIFYSHQCLWNVMTGLRALRLAQIISLTDRSMSSL